MKSEQSAFSLINLSELVGIDIGKTPARKESSYWKGVHPWVSIRDLKGDRYIEQTKECITDEGVSKSGIKIVLPNTILFSYKLSIGKVAITKIPLFTNEAIAAFPIRDTSKVDLLYLYYVMRELDFTDGGDRAVMGMTLNKAKLKALKIPLPPLAEQQKIAAILDAADTLRQKDQQLIDHYTTLSQSLFLEMFGDPVTNPMGWEKDASIKYCKCIVPGRDKPKSFTGETPWVTTNDLHHLAYTKQSKHLVGLTDSEIENVKAKVIPENSVILTCVGDLGIVSINSTPMVVNQQLHTFQCDNKNISSIFMMYAIAYQTPYMYKMSSSTTVPYMNKTICNNIPMIYPPAELQNQFAERIQQIEAQKQQAQASLEHSDTLFNSLLQRAFSGKLTGSGAV